MPAPNTPILRAATYPSASGAQANIWAPAENVSAYITDIIVTASNTTVIELELDGSAIAAFKVAQNIPMVIPLVTPIVGSVGKAFRINIGTSSTVYLTMLGYEQFHAA